MKTLPKSKLAKSQKQVFTKEIIFDGKKGLIEAVVRYDDECGNGHNSFSITGTVYSSRISKADKYCEMGGCIHDEIAKHFPKLKKYLKWHLVGSDSPMHYISNTLYHASDTDYEGLKKGEYKAFERVVTVEITNDGKKTEVYKTGQIYTNKRNNPNLKKSNENEAKLIDDFIGTLKVDYEIKEVFEDWAKSEGKEINLKGARNCAIWEDATLEQLQDEKQLKERLPSLMMEFKKDVEELGFIY